MKRSLLTVMAIGAVAFSLSVTAHAQGVMFVEGDQVGIHIATPEAPLHVVKPTPGGNAGIVDGGAFMIQRTDGGSSNIRFVVDNGTLYQSWLFRNAGTAGGFSIFNETSGTAPLLIQKNAPHASIWVAQNGVGILTQNPQAALDVNGSIFQRGGSLHADYVFEPTYDLLSIEEQADFMWRNKHLPSMAPKTVDDEGREVVELGERHRGMLEELEKAHIYISQLHDVIEQLEARVDNLEAER